MHSLITLSCNIIKDDNWLNWLIILFVVINCELARDFELEGRSRVRVGWCRSRTSGGIWNWQVDLEIGKDDILEICFEITVVDGVLGDEHFVS